MKLPSSNSNITYLQLCLRKIASNGPITTHIFIRLSSDPESVSIWMAQAKRLVKPDRAILQTFARDLHVYGNERFKRL